MKLTDLFEYQSHMDDLPEAWSNKYKKSINCSQPKGFSQRAHCAARKKRQHGGKTQSSPVHENAKNMEIRNYKKLDHILRQLCDLIDRKHDQHPEKYGQVAAAILDPQNNMTVGISTHHGGKWRHAERNALDAYTHKYGQIPEGCIVVTTCSPCSERMGDRQGESCTDLINDSPVHKVYCGYDDETQPASQRTFNMIETSDASIRNRCKQFADTFMDWEAAQKTAH